MNNNIPAIAVASFGASQDSGINSIIIFGSNEISGADNMALCAQTYMVMDSDTDYILPAVSPNYEPYDEYDKIGDKQGLSA